MSRPPNVASSVASEDHNKAERSQGVVELEKPAKDPQKDATLISKLFLRSVISFGYSIATRWL